MIRRKGKRVGNGAQPRKSNGQFDQVARPGVEPDELPKPSVALRPVSDPTGSALLDAWSEQSLAVQVREIDGFGAALDAAKQVSDRSSARSIADRLVALGHPPKAAMAAAALART